MNIRAVAPSAPNIVLLHASRARGCVFCVHAVDGSVAAFLQLSRELGAVATTYALSVVDLAERIRLPGTIAEIARYYAEQIQQVQPDGPYILVGWSTGCWIAFEIACELSRRGRRVGGLVVLDIGAPFRRLNRDPPPGSETLALSPLQQHSARRWWSFLRLYNSHEIVVPLHFWTLSEQDKSRYLVEHRHDSRLFSKNCHLLAVQDPDDLLFRFDMVELQRGAVLNYQPSPYTGPIHLFIASPQSLSLPARQRRIALMEGFWRSATAGGVCAQYMSGGHFAPLSQPGVAQVAQCLSRLTPPGGECPVAPPAPTESAGELRNATLPGNTA